MKLEEWSALKNGAKIECTYVIVFVDIMDTQLCEHNNSRTGPHRIFKLVILVIASDNNVKKVPLPHGKESDH